MYKASDYFHRGQLFLRNQTFPKHKQLANLMIYATDLCDSGCKHCLIWAKRPVKYLPKEKIFEVVSNNKSITPKTIIGLEGGEFLLHPDALEIMQWMKKNHPRFDLLSNCLKPEKLIEAVKLYTPNRLFISLDGDRDTYLHMRGKDGYDSVIRVIRELKDILPVSVMFTLSPYNDFGDMEHVAAVCKENDVDMRVGIYNNISFFDTIEQAHTTEIGVKKNDEILSFKTLNPFKNLPQTITEAPIPTGIQSGHDFAERIPKIISEFSENYDFLILYNKWRQNELKLKCFSILDSIIILPNGDVPICQNLDLKLGNIHDQTLDEVLTGEETIKQQNLHSENCNKCWINYHRKYDVALYRSFENLFGRWATKKMFGYYQWSDNKDSYKKLINDQPS
ncbi:MAG: radical SAM protein [Flavitalea sp.]